MAYRKTQSILRDHGLAPHKKLGQNFLVHRHTAERIVDLAQVQKDDIIIEVGVGLGALTHPLAAQAARVIGIEADSGLIKCHEQEHDLPENVTLIHGDILKLDLAELAGKSGGRLKILANLPYSISSPFLFRLIEHHHLVDWALLMLQKEVALRLMAKPGTKEYGAPTILMAACADVEPLLNIRPGEFHPRPKVDSMVIKLSFQPPPDRVRHADNFDRHLFTKIVRAAFGRRRKTLVNALTAGGLGLDKETIAQHIARIGLRSDIRAERLALEDFIHLTRCLDDPGPKAQKRP